MGEFDTPHQLVYTTIENTLNFLPHMEVFKAFWNKAEKLMKMSSTGMNINREEFTKFFIELKVKKLDRKDFTHMLLIMRAQLLIHDTYLFADDNPLLSNSALESLAEELYQKTTLAR